MNSSAADADVNAQRHHRDVLGATRRIVIINIVCLRLSSVERVGAFCVYLTCYSTYAHMLIYVVFVHSMCMEECGYVCLS